ncbi:MAG: hypothetical protein C0602_00070 [Denitrovibrio sp.]|nr:MAG: hypothetical protein C0602_00070 [Denitrovibrio sp.]
MARIDAGMALQKIIKLYSQELQCVPFEPPTAYFFPGSMRLGVRVASYLKWERVSHGRYKTHDGEIVQIVTRTEQLRGLPDGTRLYLGTLYRLELSDDEINYLHFKFDCVPLGISNGR